MFHAQDGFYFERQADGSVRVLIRESGTVDAPVARETIIPASAWASVVASMSREGETYDTWRTALNAQEPIEA